MSDQTHCDEEGREAHLNGEIAKALMAQAPNLFSNELQIEKMEILADKRSAPRNPSGPIRHPKLTP